VESPANILLRGPNFLGDHVMAAPFYRGLRAHYPHARITWLGPAAFSALSPEGTGFELLPYRKGMAAELRARRFDLAIGLPASASSAILFWSAGIPYRVGFAETAAIPFLTHPVRWRGRNSGRHKSDLYNDLLLELVGHPRETRGGHEVARITTPVANSLPHRPPEMDPGRRFRIVVAPGASLPLREWPYFLELIAWLRRAYPEKTITVVGTSAEAVWNKRIERLADPGIENLVGKTDLAQLVQVMEQAAFVVANDSGPAHVAASVAAVPTYVIFGPGDPAYVLPSGGNAVAIRRTDLACSPCESAVCRASVKKDCLNGLPLQTVIDAIGNQGKNSPL